MLCNLESDQSSFGTPWFSTARIEVVDCMVAAWLLAPFPIATIVVGLLLFSGFVTISYLFPKQ